MKYIRGEGIGEGVLLNYKRIPNKDLSRHDIVLVLGWTVDITRDQFEGEDRPVILQRESDLPKKWNLLNRFTLDELLARRSRPELASMYEDIMGFLEG